METIEVKILLVLVLLLAGCSDDAVAPDVAVGIDGGTPDATVDVTGLPDQTLPDMSALDLTVGDATLDTTPLDAAIPLDTTSLDTTPLDAAIPLDAGTTFPAVLEGIWLIGWSGGMNHFSWVRLSGAASGGGKAEILDGASLSVNLPFWSCSGTSSWNITAKPDTIQIHFPSSLCNGMKSSSYTFSNFSPPGSYPKGAILQASVTSAQPPGTGLSGYKFPPGQCNTTMTSCTDPL